MISMVLFALFAGHFAVADVLDNWTPRNSGTSANLLGVDYGNGNYVVVGQSGKILTSLDGTNWTNRNSGTSNTLYRVVFANNQFVAVGLGGTILTSPDGVSWTSRASGTSADLNTVDFLNGQFIADGYRATIDISTDGMNWTLQNSGISDTNSTLGVLYNAVYGNGVYVIGGQSSTILTSPDAVHWTQHAIPTSSPALAYANGVFVANGVQSHTSSFLLTSPDGVNWTVQNSLPIEGFSRIAFAQGNFVGVGGDVLHQVPAFIWSSNDGTNWFARMSGLGANLSCVQFVNYSFMTVGEHGTILQTDHFLEPPLILQQPTNQDVFPGTAASFTVLATAYPPPTYQWRFAGTNLLGQTNSSLVLTNIQSVQAGAYSVILSNSFGSITSSNAVLFVANSVDSDGDGIPDYWELLYGLNPTNSADALLHPVVAGQTNRLTYLEEYLYRLNPTTLDSDGDGLSDYDEIFLYHTNPLSPDTDGDGIPDKWELDHGLNPLVNDASDEAGFDGVSNLQVYQYDLAHTNLVDQLGPGSPFLPGSGRSNYEIINGGQHTNRYYYDHNDRLVGLESSRGISIAYTYDGNDNLTRQAVLSRSGETNGLPALWRFLNGLTNNTSPYADSDGDGWTDYQEWKAGSNPNNAASTPDLLGSPGANIASLTLPFTPSNFVVGVGQLDGQGAEQIAVGADGYPGTNINFLLVLTQGVFGWSTQRVDVGAFGITSIAVGQVTNRPRPAIYLGLRGTTNGSGRLVEFSRNGGIWQSNVVAISTNPAAFVLAVRPQDVLGTVGTTNLSDGSLLRFAPQGELWISAPESTNTSHRGLGSLGHTADGLNALRLVDPSGIEVGRSDSASSGAFRINSSGTLRTNLNAYFTMENTNDSVASQTLSNNGGVTFDAGLIGMGADFGASNVSTILSSTSNFGLSWASPFTFSLWVKANADITSGSWSIWNIVPQTGNIMGLNYEYNSGTRRLNFTRYHNVADQILYNITLGTTNWHHLVLTYNGATMTGYVDGLPTGSVASDTTLAAGPYTVGTGIGAGNNGASFFSYSSTKIDEVGIWSRALSPAEIVDLYNGGAGDQYGYSFHDSLPEPSSNSNLIWRGSSLASGFLRGTNGASVLYTFADDKNGNGLIDFGDDFVVAEYLMSGTNTSLLTLSRQPILSFAAAQGYALAVVSYLNQSNHVFFTGEPDGRVFLWAATGTTNPLQRQLFSATHIGKAWHAMSAVKTSGAGEALAGLRVDPASPNKCDIIYWPPQLQLSQVASLANTAPAAAVLPGDSLGSLASVTVRLWDAEGNASSPFLQYQLAGSTNWQYATLSALDGAPYNPATRVAALPGGFNHAVLWNALHDLGSAVATNVLLRARAQDFMLLGDWSKPTPFQIDMTLDSNGNGIPDTWEMQYFGNLLQPANGDFDGDGFSNLQEYLADTNPTNSNSSLRITGIHIVPGGVRLDWQGGIMATQYLQRRFRLNGTDSTWGDIWTNLPPTPINGSFTDSPGTNDLNFYRIRAVR